MEISVVNKGIRIKGKTGSILVDPSNKVESDVLIMLSENNLEKEKLEGVKLIISGPGEYESSGISITGKDIKGNIIYKIIDNSKIILLNSKDIKNFNDDDEVDCLLIKVTNEIKDDDFAQVNAKCVCLYGEINLASLKQEKVENISKVNLRKSQEVTGKIFLLG